MGGGKGKAVIVGDDPYDWVGEEVINRKSLFDDEDAINLLLPESWVRAGERVSLGFLPCGSADRVCEHRNDFAYFYMYVSYFVDLKFKLPFTDLQCKVLTQLNCALSQIQPNITWAFIHAFEVLMEVLEHPPSLGLFFSLFQAKGVIKGLWVNLSGYPSRAVFGLFRSSFKDFKDMYVKILDVEQRNQEDELMLDFLSFALEGERAPDLSSTSLKSFFKNRGAAKEMVMAELEKVATSDSACPTAISVKRRKVETTSHFKEKSCEVSQTLPKGKENCLSEMVLFAESQKGLHGYVENADLTSLWCEHHPIMSIADSHFQSPGDVRMLNEIGYVAINRFLQVVGKRQANIDKLLDIINENEIAVAKLSNALKAQEIEVGELKKQVQEMQPQVKKMTELQAEIERMHKVLKEAEEVKMNYGIDMFIQGFSRAVSQVRELEPNFKVEAMDVAKVVINGALVDDDYVADAE
ncbi:hypothetical protein PIB30_098483 [Stylosanthes scabra]|uniref:Transposase (Putative), gypsy type n=1 Tax=Stylosanthes scabra TaxID=79078 RepID=A0ABU6RXC1_9FABA|nr:hypothetical protein [Stylosanthes scabra]